MSEETTPAIKKMSVKDGDHENQEQKVKFNKSIILGFLAKGVTKKGAASMANVTEQTFYNYVKNDPEFKIQVEACLGGEDKIQALVNVSNAVKRGDAEMTRYLLNKTRHYEKRYDPKWMDPDMIETEKNPTTGVFEVITDLDQISGEILGDDFEYDEESGLDQMEQILMAQDDEAMNTINEIMGDEQA